MKSLLIVGVTGLVGREMLKILSARGFPVSNIDGAASARSKGMELKYGQDAVVVKGVNEIDFSKYDIALFSAGSRVSSEYAELAARQGCTVIDNTSYFRMRPEVPLVVPEVNFLAIKPGNKIIANPNCSTIQAVLPLKVLHDRFRLEEVEYTTYQSVGGAGQKGIAELMGQTIDLMSNHSPRIETFTKQIAFNVVPQIGSFDPNGYTIEELKMMNETRKILGLPDLRVSATCARVPVVIGHAVSVVAKFKHNIDLDSVRASLAVADGIQVWDDINTEHFATPLDAAGQDKVLVSRLRKHPDYDNVLLFWCVADNVRKGAALNAVQIAELL